MRVGSSRMSSAALFDDVNDLVDICVAQALMKRQGKNTLIRGFRHRAKTRGTSQSFAVVAVKMDGLIVNVRPDALAAQLQKYRVAIACQSIEIQGDNIDVIGMVGRGSPGKRPEPRHACERRIVASGDVAAPRKPAGKPAELTATQGGLQIR